MCVLPEYTLINRYRDISYLFSFKLQNKLRSSSFMCLCLGNYFQLLYFNFIYSVPVGFFTRIHFFFPICCLLCFQNKCTQPEDVKLCTLILRPATAGPQRKKVVSFSTFSSLFCLFAIKQTYLRCPPSLPSFLPPCVSDPGKGGSGSPP